MKTLYSILISTMLLISSNTFAQSGWMIHGYLMPLDDATHGWIMKLNPGAKGVLSFSVICVDGYRYLATKQSTIQMKGNAKGKSINLTCDMYQ